MKYNEIKEWAEKSESNFILFLFKRLYFTRIKKLNILAHDKCYISDVSKISLNGLLKIGVEYIGFTTKYDRTQLNIRGKLNFLGNYTIGKGCVFDIGPNAVVEIGNGGFVSANTRFIISYGLKIGNLCAISWGCQFLDNDFHSYSYPEMKEIQDKTINIGNHVWIGANVSIYKGVNIPNGCIIASESVVKNSFNEENVLIAGNPARIIKRNVSWDF